MNASAQPKPNGHARTDHAVSYHERNGNYRYSRFSNAAIEKVRVCEIATVEAKLLPLLVRHCGGEDNDFCVFIDKKTKTRRPLTQADIARLLDASPSHVDRVMDEYEAAGHIERDLLGRIYLYLDENYPKIPPELRRRNGEDESLHGGRSKGSNSPPKKYSRNELREIFFRSHPELSQIRTEVEEWRKINPEMAKKIEIDHRIDGMILNFGKKLRQEDSQTDAGESPEASAENGEDAAKPNGEDTTNSNLHTGDDASLHQGCAVPSVGTNGGVYPYIHSSTLSPLNTDSSSSFSSNKKEPTTTDVYKRVLQDKLPALLAKHNKGALTKKQFQEVESAIAALPEPEMAARCFVNEHLVERLPRLRNIGGVMSALEEFVQGWSQQLEIQKQYATTAAAQSKRDDAESKRFEAELRYSEYREEQVNAHIEALPAEEKSKLDKDARKAAAKHVRNFEMLTREQQDDLISRFASNIVVDKIPLLTKEEFEQEPFKQWEGRRA